MTNFKLLQSSALKTTILGLLAVTILFFALVGAASAAEPWWHLTFASQPSYIQPGKATDDVQRVTVAMGTGEYHLYSESVAPRNVGPRGDRGRFDSVALDVGATPAEVQAALEGPAPPEEANMYGVGNVEVTSPCTGTPTPACPETFNRYEVYEIKFVGEWTDQYVFPMQTEYEQVKVVQAVKGRTDGVLVVNAVNLGDADTVGPFTIADELPKGLTAVWVEALADASTSYFGSKIPPVACKLGALSCTFTGLLQPNLPKANSVSVGVIRRVCRRMTVSSCASGWTRAARRVARCQTGRASPVAALPP